MIRGLGVDIVAVRRIRSLLDQSETGFLSRTYTEAEVAYCSAKAHSDIHFAGRFAAKEAVFKSMRLGTEVNFTWNQIEIVSESDAPAVVLHEPLRQIAESLEISQFLLSISHEKDYAVASALCMT